MVMLYLIVQTLLPLLAFVLAWWLLARLINARVARMPRVPLNLPEHSSSPRKNDRRIYARKLRRKPGLRTATRAATAPRSWHFAAAVLSLMALIATVLVIPDGARFQVMVGNLIGYPGIVIEAQVPVASQPVVLQAWQPALAQLGGPRRCATRSVAPVVSMKLMRSYPCGYGCRVIACRWPSRDR